eukprot:TRINITY_DN3114_c0_g2_i3.p1 TRINITY_DN3114_c0_g2~~TRINITY_DN3114_c0_g2_i3.p1  ORF type:complete len:305 (+),score=54.55 TRINITY_DN3114_c0_g2_i3:234-1148(+)
MRSPCLQRWTRLGRLRCGEQGVTGGLKALGSEVPAEGTGPAASEGQQRVANWDTWQEIQQRGIGTSPSRVADPPDVDGLSSSSQEEAHSGEQSASLPLAQRCKNLLVSNWRGQLSSIKAGSDRKDARSLHASLVPCAVLAGKPLVWVARDDPHGVNLLMDDRGSLLVGHTDPPGLANMFTSAGKALPRTIMVGEFVAVEKTELEYIRSQAGKQLSATQAALDRLGPTLQSFLEGKAERSATGGGGESQPQVSDHVAALQRMSSPSEDAAVFRLYARSCQYVDVQNARHPVQLADIGGAAKDPLG